MQKNLTKFKEMEKGLNEILNKAKIDKINVKSLLRSVTEEIELTHANIVENQENSDCLLKGSEEEIKEQTNLLEESNKSSNEQYKRMQSKISKEKKRGSNQEEDFPSINQKQDSIMFACESDFG